MKDLTILIQGPYFEFKEYNSNRNINILKKNFPNAKILISTWKNQNKFKPDTNDKIIYNEDPGAVKDNYSGSSTNGSNILRQIISVKNGLGKVDTKFTLKIRSDCYFASNKILKLDLEKYKYDNKFKIFKKRIITSSIGSLNQRNSNILYNYSDWFNLGLTNDLKKIWGNVKIDNDDINYFTRYSYKKKNFYGKDWDLKFTAEQFIYFKSISKHVEKKILHAHDFSKSKLLAAENYLVNNYFLVDPDSIDFVFPKYDPKINHNLKRNETNLRGKELIYLSYNQNDWLRLYCKSKKYYQFFINLNKSYFLIKFKIKNLFYKYFN
jgi:hypothetical protein